jgi:hypothetical protein
MGRRNSTAAPGNAAWHFVSIPIHPNAGEPSGYDSARDCPQQECVVAKIEEFERVLADPQASQRQRLEARVQRLHSPRDGDRLVSSAAG